jgi:hypothetical protein
LVNEFESFDAGFLLAKSYTKRKGDGSEMQWSDENSLQFIEKFWIIKLTELIDEWLNEKTSG